VCRQLGGVPTYRQPAESVGQSLLGHGRDEGHHPFRIHRTTSAVHVPGWQDAEHAPSQQPLKIGEIREIGPLRLHTGRADVRQAQPILPALAEEVRPAPVVVRSAAVYARRMTP